MSHEYTNIPSLAGFSYIREKFVDGSLFIAIFIRWSEGSL